MTITSEIILHISQTYLYLLFLGWIFVRKLSGEMETVKMRHLVADAARLGPGRPLGAVRREPDLEEIADLVSNLKLISVILMFRACQLQT
jgi:hypothetical protein